METLSHKFLASQQRRQRKYDVDDLIQCTAHYAHAISPRPSLDLLGHKPIGYPSCNRFCFSLTVSESIIPVGNFFLCPLLSGTVLVSVTVKILNSSVSALSAALPPLA